MGQQHAIHKFVLGTRTSMISSQSSCTIKAGTASRI